MVFNLSTLYSYVDRYMAPEVFLNQQYDTKVDVFSFSLILQEVQHFHNHSKLFDIDPNFKRNALLRCSFLTISYLQVQYA